MEHATQVRILRELFRQLDDNVNVDAGAQVRNPTDVYTSPAIAAAEWQQLFRRHPQVIGLSRDLPEPGSYITTEDFEIPYFHRCFAEALELPHAEEVSSSITSLRAEAFSRQSVG